MRVILWMLCLFFCSLSQAEDGPILSFESELNDKTVSFKELIEEIRTTDKNINIRNVKVRWNEATDRAYMDGRFLSKSEPEVWRIRYWIKFENCEFDPDFWLLLRNIQFDFFLSFFHCSNIKIIMDGCVFQEAVRINSNDIEFIKFEECDFQNGFKFNRSYVTDQLSFHKCSFSVKEQALYTNMMDMETRIFAIDNRVESLNLSIEKCSFHVPPAIVKNPQYFIKLSNTNFNNLKFNNNKVNATVDFSASTIENLFMSYNCDYQQKIIVNALNLNPINTKIQWERIAGGKLAVMDTANVLYSAIEADSLKDEFVANELISCYANFYSAFKSQGTRLFANACYVEWKDVETTYLSNIYRSSESVIPFFTYIMNVFLKFFCDYGTNPFQSIVISLYVILGFALVYYLYPENLRTGNKRDFFLHLKLIAQHYYHPVKWTRVRMKQLVAREQPTSYTTYVKFIKNENKSAPVLFRAIGTSMFKTIRLRSMFELFLVGIIRKLPVRFFNFPLYKRIPLLTIYWLGIFLFLIDILITRIAEAVGLSLNVFSTLGFGSLPENGLPRYLCIAEGFTGWFLLSIFSVALISQVIQ